MALNPSPFFFPGSVAKADSLSIVHLKRDLQIPTILRTHDDDDEGYWEGKVINTRFGSFPHSTLIDLSWGSQVRASKVDTGSRGRRENGKKRKREHPTKPEPPNKAGKLDGDEETPKEERIEKEAVAASSGFVHLLPPTPENWTSSLPHRTQVVYTPDYSYILHRIRARPGTNTIEAGAGSGSFTHASARAVFNGYPSAKTSGTTREQNGKVWSYEFHAQRYEKLQKEIRDHGLEGLVEITHRDVCQDGFLVNGESPNASSIFLDLPAPWLALPHLSRSRPPQASSPTNAANAATEGGSPIAGSEPWRSPLHPGKPTHLCTFSPCIEQVQTTISHMRKLGWVDISMVELSQKRLEIRRERVGIDNGAARGVQLTPASVDEAVARLRQVEGNFKIYHEAGKRDDLSSSRKQSEDPKQDKDDVMSINSDLEAEEAVDHGWEDGNGNTNPNSRAKILSSLINKKIYKEGLLVHRTEPEVKVHTSYLVFAILPVEWSDEDERKAREKWPVGDSKGTVGGKGWARNAGFAGRPLGKKALKKQARAAAQKAKDTVVGAVDGAGNGAELKPGPSPGDYGKATDAPSNVEVDVKMGES